MCKCSSPSYPLGIVLVPEVGAGPQLCARAGSREDAGGRRGQDARREAGVTARSGNSLTGPRVQPAVRVERGHRVPLASGDEEAALVLQEEEGRGNWGRLAFSAATERGVEGLRTNRRAEWSPG